MSNPAVQSGTGPAYGSFGRTQPFGTWRRQRQRFLVDRKLQLRLAGELATLLLLVAVPVLVTLHVLSELVSLQRVDVLQVAPLEVADLSLVWGYALTIFVCLGVIIFTVSILYSHRIAGPAVKLEAHLRRMAEGELRARVALRKSDHLSGLAEAVNGVGDRWNGLVDALRAEIKGLRERGRTQDKGALEAHCAALDALLERYK